MAWTQTGTPISLEALGAIIHSDGSDGNVTFDGSATILGLVPSSQVYTLTRDIWPDNMTVNSGVIVKPNGFCIYVKQTLTNAGAIAMNGNPGASSVAGVQFINQGTLYIAAGAGGAGRNTTGAGSPGAGSGGNNVTGAASGAGGSAGGANTGGIGSTSSSPTAIMGSIRDLSFGTRRRLVSGTTLVVAGGGAGGGGGGADVGTGTAVSGGGGSAGGGLLISCCTLNNTGTIAANGGAGAAGVATGNGKAGGGGGGAGGWIWLAVRKIVSLGTISVAGGVAGNSTGGAAVAVDGAIGVTVILTGN